MGEAGTAGITGVQAMPTGLVVEELDPIGGATTEGSLDPGGYIAMKSHQALRGT